METITDGPMVKNLLCNADNISLIPGPETNIPQATEQLSLCAVTSKPTFSSAHAPQRAHTCDTNWAYAPQLESLCAAAKDPEWCNGDPTCCNEHLTQPNKQTRGDRFLKQTEILELNSMTELKKLRQNFNRRLQWSRKLSANLKKNHLKLPSQRCKEKWELMKKVKRTNGTTFKEQIYGLWESQKEKREKGIKSLLKDILAENFPSWGNRWTFRFMRP